MTKSSIFSRRKVLGLAGLLTAGALALSACGGGGAGGTDAPESAAPDTPAAEAPETSDADGAMTVGVSMPTQTSERWIADGNAVQKGLEAAGHSVTLQFANDDIPTQTQQIDQMITNGVDVLVIAAIDGSSLTSQLQSAADKGIPVVAYDRLLRDSENVDFYVSFDNYKVGVAQAQSLLFGMGVTSADGKPVADAPKGQNIEVFAGSPDDNNAKFFFDGAMDTLKPFLDDGTLVIKSGQDGFDQVAILRWAQDTAQKRMEDLITSTYAEKDLKGVLSPYDGISRGIITALQNAGYGPTIAEGLPIVTGQDAEIASVKLINDGVQWSTIFKDTRLLADQAVLAVLDITSGNEPEANNTEDYDNGKKVVPSYLLEVSTINQDNIESELIDSGYFTLEQVQKGA